MAARSPGPVRVDPARHRAAEVGDEPLLLARFAPTIVSRDRAAGADAARAAGAGSIVMDDGFQSPGLHKDRSILVVDGRRGIGNGKVFPAGPLRAPLESQLRRAQALLVVGAGTAGEAVAAAAQAHGLPVFHGRLEPDAQALAVLKGRPVLAFAGIGDPEKFFATLRDAGIDVRRGGAVPRPSPLSPVRGARADRARRARGARCSSPPKRIWRGSPVRTIVAALAGRRAGVAGDAQGRRGRRVPELGAYLTCCGCSRRITASGEA